MTLPEIMIALAVFGIVLVVFTSAAKFYGSLNAGNLDRLRMMELARSITELIKADAENNYENNYPEGGGTNPSVPYLVTGDAAPRYAVNYSMEEDTGTGLGKYLKITVGPENSDPVASAGNFVLVSWLPHVVDTGESTYTPTPVYSSPYDPEMWVEVDDSGNTYDSDNWVISEEGISRTTGGGPETTHYIYYNTIYNTFDFTSYIEFEKIKSTQNTGTGIVFKTDTDDPEPDRYIFNIYNGGNNQYPTVSLNFTKNGNVQSGFPVDTEIPISIVSDPDACKYYLQATGDAGGTLTLKFGLCDDNGEQLEPEETFEGIPFDPSRDYLLGLFDETAEQTNSTFTISSSSSLAQDDCQM